jgi:hypothetical protein
VKGSYRHEQKRSALFSRTCVLKFSSTLDRQPPLPFVWRPFLFQPHCHWEVETGAENSLVDLRKALAERPVLSSASGLRDFVESAGTMSAFPLVALGSPENKTHIPTEAIVEGSGEILGKSLVSAVSDSKYPQSQEYFC